MAKAKPRLRAEATQPGLFLLSELPDNPKLQAAAKRYVHSGRITCKDEERAAAIAEAFLSCGLVLPVARRFHVSPKTVHAVLEVLEEEGKLARVKERLSAKLGLLAEVSAEAAVEMVVAGKTQANVLPINVGVAIEKKAMLDGEATVRIESVEVRISAADLIARVQRLAAAAPAIDVESSVSTPETQGNP